MLEEYTVTTGVRHGDELSPALFNFALELVVWEALRKRVIRLISLILYISYFS